MTEALIKQFESFFLLIDTYIEPCVGSAWSIALPFSRKGCRMITNDIDPDIRAHHHMDARKFMRSYNELFKAPDWIITNPPFVDAYEMLLTAFEVARKGTIFQTRISFVEPTLIRSEFFEEHPPDFELVLPRYSFTQDGKTDSVTTAWFCWWNWAAWDSYSFNPPKGIAVVPKRKIFDYE